jgi:hypothetical protein
VAIAPRRRAVRGDSDSSPAERQLIALTQAGEKKWTIRDEFAGAVQKWALDEKLMVKKRSEWWARVTSLVALLLVARRAVATLNRLIRTIPWIFAAGPAGVSQREYYQAPS